MFLLGAGLLVVAGRRTDRDAWRWRVALAFALVAWALLWGPSFLAQAQPGHSDWIPRTSFSGFVVAVGQLATPLGAWHLRGAVRDCCRRHPAVATRSGDREGVDGCFAVPVAARGRGWLLRAGAARSHLDGRVLGGAVLDRRGHRCGRAPRAMGRRGRRWGGRCVERPVAAGGRHEASTPDVVIRHLEAAAAPGDVVGGASGAPTTRDRVALRGDPRRTHPSCPRPASTVGVGDRARDGHAERADLAARVATAKHPRRRATALRARLAHDNARVICLRPRGQPVRRVALPVAAALLRSALVGLSGTGRAATAPPSPGGIHKIKHVVVIMQENRSFDSYFGTYPGADGIPMRNGVPTVCLPDPRKRWMPSALPDASDVNGGGPHGAANGSGRHQRRPRWTASSPRRSRPRIVAST